MKYGRFTFLRFVQFGISLIEFADVRYHRSLFYISWDEINGFDFSILWLKSHGLPLAGGVRILDAQYEPLEKDLLLCVDVNLVL